MDWTWWLLAALALGIIELFTLDFFFLMLGLSAMTGGLASYLGAPLWGQILTFSITALALLFFVRPWARSYLSRNTPQIQTNVGALIGAEAVAMGDVTTDSGQVHLSGSTWSARSASGETFADGDRLVVVEIDGATAVVAAKASTH